MSDLDDTRPARRRLGRFELVRELARGGMGVVHEAVDPDLGRRRVAIKELLDPDAGPVALERFGREAAVMARLAHPHIVGVHEAGVERDDDGRQTPYLVMEYVDGQPLSVAYPRMSLVERVEVLRAVAEAVGVAHAAGVVHRDLKPANVLVDRDGRPRVTDFGLAAWREAPGGLTRTGALLGTPHYMAPEQIAPSGEVTVDARADVWALGVMLYELLADRRPYEAGTLPALAHAIGRTPPPPIKRRVPRPLEAICRKALTVDPRGRHADGNAVADDLGRWLTGRPVSARSGLGMRLRVGLARRPLRTRAAVLLGLAVLILLGLKVHADRRFARHRDAATSAAERGDWSTALVATEQALALRETASLRALHERCQTELARPRPAPPVARPAPTDPRVAELRRLIDETRSLRYLTSADVPARMATVARRLEQLQGRLGNAPSAHDLGLLGAGWGLLGRLSRAEQALERALKQTPRDPTLRTRLGRVLVRHATMLLFTYGSVATVRRRHAATFERAAELLTVTDPAWAPGPLEAHQLRCYRALASDRPDAVARLCQDGLTRFGERPGSELFHLLLAAVQRDARGLTRVAAALRLRPHDDWALFLHGATLAQLGRHEAALQSLDRALRLNPELAHTWSSRGACQLALGRLAEAMADLDKGIELAPRMAILYSNRAGVWLARMRLPEALKDMTRAIELAPEDARLRANRAGVRLRTGDLDGTLADLDQVERLTPGKASTVAMRGSVWLSRGKPREALTQFDRALALDPQLALAHRGRGLALQALRDVAGARAAFDRAIVCAPRDPDGHTLRGKLRLATRDRPGALEDLSAALRLDPRNVAALLARASTHELSGRIAEAIADLDGVIALQPQHVGAYGMRGALRQKLGRLDGAISDFRRVLRTHPEHAYTHTFLAQVLYKRKDLDGARPHLDKAVSLQPDQREARVLRGIIRREQGDLAGALDDHLELIQLAPEWWPGWYHLGASLWRAGKQQRARACWGKADQIVPSGERETLRTLIRQTVAR